MNDNDSDQNEDQGTLKVLGERDLFGAEEGFVHNQSRTVPIERLLFVVFNLNDKKRILEHIQFGTFKCCNQSEPICDLI